MPADWAILYSDGSEVEEKVGSAAALFTPGSEPKTINYNMGGSRTSTIYSAELYGIGLALFLALHNAKKKNVIVFTDNQSAIKKLRNPDNKSGQEYLKSIISKLEHLKSEGCTVRIQWVPGHRDIEGNELVDKLAKEAALKPGIPKAPDLALLRTTIKRTLKADFNMR